MTVEPNLMDKAKKITQSENGTAGGKIITCPKMTFAYQPKNELPAIRNNNTTVVYRGEVFALLGLPGNGKTTQIEFSLLAFIVSKYNLTGYDTCGYQVNSIGLKALVCDTERPGDDVYKTYRNVHRRLGQEKQFLNDDGTEFKDITYLMMAEVGEINQMWKILEQQLATGEYELVILDGILDFCLSMLDDKECAKVMKRLRSLAVKHNVAIVVTIHPNKGTANPAGHIGAFLYRYCRAMLLVRNTTDKNVKELTTDFDFFKLSHASPGDFEPVYFTWDQSQGMMVSCDAPAPPMYKVNFLKQAVMELRLKGHHEIPSAILKEHYGKLAGIGPEAQKKHIGRAVEDGLLSTSGKGKSIKYLPAIDWQISGNQGSGTDAPYIDMGAIPDTSGMHTKSPNNTRMPPKEYPKEWDTYPNNTQ